MLNITHDKEPEDIGIGIGVRMKTGISLQDALHPNLGTPKIESGVQVQYIKETIHIEPPLTWSYWWSFTKKLISHKWRKFYGACGFHRKN